MAKRKKKVTEQESSDDSSVNEVTTVTDPVKEPEVELRKPRNWEPPYIHLRITNFQHVDIEPDKDYWKVTTWFDNKDDADKFHAAIAAYVEESADDMPDHPKEPAANPEG